MASTAATVRRGPVPGGTVCPCASHYPLSPSQSAAPATTASTTRTPWSRSARTAATPRTPTWTGRTTRSPSERCAPTNCGAACPIPPPRVTPAQVPCGSEHPGESHGSCDGFGRCQCAPPYITDDCSVGAWRRLRTGAAAARSLTPAPQWTAPTTAPGTGYAAWSTRCRAVCATRGGKERRVTRVRLRPRRWQRHRRHARALRLASLASPVHDAGLTPNPALHPPSRRAAICPNNCSYPNGVCNNGTCNCTMFNNPYNRSIEWRKWGLDDCSGSARALRPSLPCLTRSPPSATSRRLCRWLRACAFAHALHPGNRGRGVLAPGGARTQAQAPQRAAQAAGDIEQRLQALLLVRCGWCNSWGSRLLHVPPAATPSAPAPWARSPESVPLSAGQGRGQKPRSQR